jgi:hypothetical protein
MGAFASGVQLATNSAVSRAVRMLPARLDRTWRGPARHDCVECGAERVLGPAAMLELAL